MMCGSGRFPEGICVVTQPARREGEKTHAHQLLDILSEITNVVLLTANLESDSGVRDEYDVVELSEQGMGDTIPEAAGRFVLNQLRMCAAIARQDEKVVLFFGATAYLLPVLFARIIGRTTVVQPRGDVPLSLRLAWEERMPEPVARMLASLVAAFERIGFHAANAIITYTPSMAEQLDLCTFENKLYTNGARYIDTEVFSPQIPFDDRDNRVGFVGRFDVEKGIPTLVEVARRLPQDMIFRFVGDGDYRDFVATELEEEIEEGQIELEGWVRHDQISGEFNRLKLLVLPSHPTEGLPTVILESLACGTPVYASPVSSVQDVLREGEIGFLMTDMDSVVISNKIDQILHRDDLSEISSNGRQLIEDEYSLESAKQRFRDILIDLVGQGQRNQ